MKKIKRNNKKNKKDLSLQNFQPAFDPFQIDSFRKYKKKRQGQKQHFISVSMQTPVFTEYTHLNLKRNHSRYHRISRTITQNKSLKLGKINFNNICQTKDKNLRENPKYNSSSQKNNLLRSVTSTSNQNFTQKSLQNIKQEKWNKQIQKYMMIKQQFSGFNKQEQKFPLMKLNRCNQIKRKLMFGSNMADDKPSFIYSMETEDPEELTISKTKIVLPGLSKSIPKNKNINVKISKQQMKKTQFKQKTQQNSLQKQVQNQDQQMVNICKSLPKATNQNQKILVNFISQYFKQKLKSSRKKRYNYQRTYTQITAPLQINISHLKGRQN